MNPSNIGVSTVDHNVDRIAGARSRKQWEGVEERQAYKMDVLRQHPGKTGHDLMGTPDGGYKVAAPKERQTREGFRKFHNQKLAELARAKRR